MIYLSSSGWYILVQVTLTSLELKQNLLDMNFYIERGTFSLTRWFLKVNIKYSVIYLSDKIPENVYVYEVS